VNEIVFELSGFGAAIFASYTLIDVVTERGIDDGLEVFELVNTKLAVR
jgi:hypothetical protein